MFAGDCPPLGLDRADFKLLVDHDDEQRTRQASKGVGSSGALLPPDLCRPLLAPQVVYSLERVDLDRRPLWVVHDKLGGCSWMAHVVGATKRWIMDEHIFLEHIRDDPRCVACIAGCGCTCSCYTPPGVSAARSGKVRTLQ